MLQKLNGDFCSILFFMFNLSDLFSDYLKF